MALLTPDQLLRIQQIVRDASTALGISTMGLEVSDTDLQRLADMGYIDPGATDNLIRDSFTYGVLMTTLPKVKDMGIKEFERHLRQNPVPLSPEEREAYNVARTRAGMFLRRSGRLNARTSGFERTLKKRLSSFVSVARTSRLKRSRGARV